MHQLIQGELIQGELIQGELIGADPPAQVATAVMGPAEHLVSDLGRAAGVSDQHGIALPDHPVLDHPGVLLARPAAPTQHLDLDRRDLVGKFDQPLGPRE
ncbi:MAG: hypothetical protein QOE89_1394, partial [Pseudonocardiales bacterium]|nr:hypothetical protein [Pseudonocardiales bacterium]